MRYRILAVSLCVSLFPALAFAAPIGPACDLVDREALVALKLGEARMKAEHKEIPATGGAPKQGMDTCAIALQDQPLPSLTVSMARLPEDSNTVKPVCSWQTIPGAGIELATCNTTVKRTFVSFALAAKGANDPAMKTTIRSQFERLVERFAGPASQATSSR